MSEELIEQVMFALFTAEASSKVTNDVAAHIAKMMTKKYGGNWSVAAASETGSYMYIRPANGHLAVFIYDVKRWYVYKHDSSNISPTTTPDEHCAASALPALTFRSVTEMSSAMKEQLLFAIFTAEIRNIVGQARVDHIGTKMEKSYGGTWSVWSYTNGGGLCDRLSPNYAVFDYEGKLWTVGKNA